MLPVFCRHLSRWKRYTCSVSGTPFIYHRNSTEIVIMLANIMYKLWIKCNHTTIYCTNTLVNITALQYTLAEIIYFMNTWCKLLTWMFRSLAPDCYILTKNLFQHMEGIFKSIPPLLNVQGRPSCPELRYLEFSCNWYVQYGTVFIFF